MNQLSYFFGVEWITLNIIELILFWATSKSTQLPTWVWGSSWWFRQCEPQRGASPAPKKHRRPATVKAAPAYLCSVAILASHRSGYLGGWFCPGFASIVDRPWTGSFFWLLGLNMLVHAFWFISHFWWIHPNLVGKTHRSCCKSRGYEFLLATIGEFKLPFLAWYPPYCRWDHPNFPNKHGELNPYDPYYQPPNTTRRTGCQPLNPSSGSTKKFPFSFASRRSFTNSAAVSAYSSPLGTIPATMSWKPKKIWSESYLIMVRVHKWAQFDHIDRHSWERDPGFSALLPLASFFDIS